MVDSGDDGSFRYVQLSDGDNTTPGPLLDN